MLGFSRSVILIISPSAIKDSSPMAVEKIQIISTRCVCCWQQQQSVIETRGYVSLSSCRLHSRILEDTSDPRLNQPVQTEPPEGKAQFR